MLRGVPRRGDRAASHGPLPRSVQLRGLRRHRTITSRATVARSAEGGSFGQRLALMCHGDPNRHAVKATGSDLVALMIHGRKRALAR